MYVTSYITPVLRPNLLKIILYSGAKPTATGVWLLSSGHGHLLPPLNSQLHGTELRQETGRTADSQKTKLIGNKKYNP